MLREYIKPVEFQIIMDDGEEWYLPALLNVDTGALMVQGDDKSEQERRDSSSVIIRTKGLTVILDVCGTNDDYRIHQKDLGLARLILGQK